jgi:hypothetical protein
MKGVAISPRNAPNHTDADWLDFWSKVQAFGSHVNFFANWAQPTHPAVIIALRDEARRRGLRFHLTIDALTLDRRAPGKGSFTHPFVAADYFDYARACATIRPDVLTLAAEINVLAHHNPAEYVAYTALERAMYSELKVTQPGLPLSVSFQWDVMIASLFVDPLFQMQYDVLGLTSYPYDRIPDPSAIPPHYYSCIRNMLPDTRIMVSEIGWTCASSADEARQDTFYARLPTLMAGLAPESVTFALMHDIEVYQSPLDRVGFHYRNGKAKRCWGTVERLKLI